ncbi:MAG: hypothetical protein GF317_24205 [Candidatus Lokiarchaeota archaeon]|nr:hypothetical protein [Candidatus Lokiarchaeota archaeon]MBD3202477.1 hypothetical protein [Candidatus Lokiarchaeota archaeon]
MKEINWSDFEWTQKSYKLLKGIEEFPENKKIIVLLRHSHRYESGDLMNHENDLLTPIGHQYANLFGKHFPKRKPIRIYHSKVKRCKETADGIKSGMKETNKLVEMKGDLDVLYDIKVQPDVFYREANKYPLDQLVYRWAAGLYSEEIIISFQKYVREAAKAIWSFNEKPMSSGVEIHISHDFILACLRFGWFGFDSNGCLPDYLTGFAFTIMDAETIQLFDFDQFKTVETPHWWNHL